MTTKRNWKTLRTPQQINTVRDIDFLWGFETTGKEVIDLGPIEFIKPVGVVALLAIIERLTRRSDMPKMAIQLPENPDVQEYLRLTGVFDAMREHFIFEGRQPEEIIPKIQPVRPMVPCTHFVKEYDIEQLASQMEAEFQTELVGYISLLQTCQGIFSELAANVVYHAESDGGYVLAQQYNYSSGPVVEIAVADCGIGIRSSLQKNPSHGMISSDIQAIEMSLREGVSSLRNPHRGYGLHHVTGDVKHNNNREMTIRSGQGILNIRGDGKVTKDYDSPTYSGTIVSVVIPCYST